MKKSLLLTLEFPPQVGGVATYYYNVCKNLPADKIVVLAPQYPQAENFDNKQNFAIIREKMLTELAETALSKIPITNKLALKIRRLNLLKKIYSLVKTHQIEFIQVGNVLPLGTLAYLNFRRHKIPYSVYTHGLDVLLPQKSIQKKILLKTILDKAKIIIANSHFTSDEIVKLGIKPEKIAVIYPCPNISNIEISEWKVDEIKEDYNLKDKKILLTVGRLIERKGHEMVIKALKEIIKKVPNVLYLIVGSGPYQQILQNLVNKNSLRDYVRFLDDVSNDGLPAFYQNCDVFIMPAKQIGPDVEGFGIVFLEANQFGKPVIGGRSGGIPEAIIDGKTGILVDPTSLEAITNAILKLLTDSAYAERLGMQGMERVLEQFDWPIQVEKIKKLLE